MISRNKAVNAFIVEKLLRRIGVEFHGFSKAQFKGCDHSTNTYVRMSTTREQAYKFQDQAGLLQEGNATHFISTTPYKDVKRSCKVSKGAAVKVPVTLTTYRQLSGLCSCYNNGYSTYLMDGVSKARKDLESDPRIRDKGEEGYSEDRRATHVAEVYGATTKSDTSHVTTDVGKHENNRSHFRAHRQMNQVAEDGQIAHVAHVIQLQHYGKGEKQPWAEGVSPTMRCRNVYCADESSYKDVIRTLAKANNLAGVMGHFEAMQTQGFTPDMNTYLTVCEVLGRAGRMEEASRIYETM